MLWIKHLIPCNINDLIDTYFYVNKLFLTTKVCVLKRKINHSFIHMLQLLSFLFWEIIHPLSGFEPWSLHGTEYEEDGMPMGQRASLTFLNNGDDYASINVAKPKILTKRWNRNFLFWQLFSFSFSKLTFITVNGLSDRIWVSQCSKNDCI